MLNDFEQGFLLGSTSSLKLLDRCACIRGRQAGRYFYCPDSIEANFQIQQWNGQGICFCGFVHSHLVDRTDLSNDDIDFAFRIYDAYSLPYLWFGVGAVVNHSVEFAFYTITEVENKKMIFPVEIRIVT